MSEPFSLPPALAGKPLPIGQVKKVSPSEAAVLADAGWDGQSAIPPGFAELQQIAREQAQSIETDNLPPPVDPSTPPLKLPKEVDISDLSPEQREFYQGVLKEAFESAQRHQERQAELAREMPSRLGPGVASAIQIASEEVTAKKAAEPTEDAEKPPEITEDDRNQFVESWLGGKPFRKEYLLLGGRIVVTVRTLETREIDLISEQLGVDRKLTEDDSLFSLVSHVHRYQTALQVEKVASKMSLLWQQRALSEYTLTQAQQDQGHTPAYAVSQALLAGPLKAAHVSQKLTDIVVEFNDLVKRLNDEARSPDF